MPPADPENRSTLLALYIPAELDARVEDARNGTNLDRSKFIRDRVTRQARLPVRAAGTLTAGPKVRRNVRWHPDEVAVIEAYAAAAWQTFGRRLGVEDAVVELLALSVGGPVEVEAPVVAERDEDRPVAPPPGLDVRDLVVEAVRAEIRPVLDLLRTSAGRTRPRTQTDTTWIRIARMGLEVAVGSIRSARMALQPVGSESPDTTGALQSIEAALSELNPYLDSEPDVHLTESGSAAVEVESAIEAETPGTDLAARLRAVRARRKLTQPRAAAAAGVAPVTYQRAEQDQRIGSATRQLLEAWIAG